MQCKMSAGGLTFDIPGLNKVLFQASLLRDKLCCFYETGEFSLSAQTSLPEVSARISQACWDTDRLHQSFGPPWSRPLKSTAASVQFYHPE